MPSQEPPIPSPSSAANWLFETVKWVGRLALLTWGSACLGVRGSPMELISHCLPPVALKLPPVDSPW